MKKKQLFPFLILIFGFLPPFDLQAQMVIGYSSSSHPAAAVEFRIPRGILIPRLTYEQKNLLSVDSTASGLVVYQTDRRAGYYVYDGRSWMNLMPLDDANNDTLSSASFAEVAFSGDYKDLKNKPIIWIGDDGEAIAFAPVALSGDYNDLTNKPEIPEDIPTLAPLAYSGHYRDLSGIPTIPTHVKAFETDDYYLPIDEATRSVWNASAAQTVPTHLRDLDTDYHYRLVTDKDISAWDSAANRTVPTHLRDLKQDSLHRTITETQRERWNTHAGTNIPTALADYRTDDYNDIITLSERRNWDEAAKRKIPTRLADLQSDEYAQTVTDKDITLWDSAANRKIPTRLRDLKQDSLHRTLATMDIAAFNEAAARDIPTSVTDLATDYSNLIVSEEQVGRWNEAVTMVGFSGDYNDLTNKPQIHDSLSQILTDDFYQTVSEADKQRWNDMTGRRYKTYLTDLTEDADHRVPVQRDIDRWNSGAEREIPDLAAAAFSGNYADIPAEYKYKPYSENLARTGRFEYLNNQSQDYPTWAPVAESGDYNDLNGRPDELYAGRENITYRDLADTPMYQKVALTGDYNDLADAAELRKMSRYLSDGTSVHISERMRRDTLERMGSTLTSAPGTQSHFTGSYDNLQLKSNISIGTELHINTSNYRPETENAIVTYKLANELDHAAAASFSNLAEDIVPEGSVIMWYSMNGAPIPDCWRPLDKIPGRFPVGVGGDPFGAFGATGGSEQHTLVGEELPAHRHRTGMGGYRFDSGTDEKNFNYFSYNREKRISNTIAIDPTGGDQPHENRPPYFSLYILQKSKAACKSK